MKTEKVMWSKFSKDRILQLGNTINWDYSSGEMSSNQMWDELQSKLLQITSCAPKTKIKCSKNGDIISKPPWDCAALKRNRTQKDTAWCSLDADPTSVHLILALQKQSLYEKLETKKNLRSRK